MTNTKMTHSSYKRSKVLAAIDLGSNTIRLMVGSFEEGRLVPLVKESNITRLGKDFHKTDELSKESWGKSVSVLERYSATIKEHNVPAISVLATGVMRTAKNSKLFIEEVFNKTGLAIRVISGEEEARLTALGVMSAVSSKSCLIFDVGGGSTEFIISKDNTPNFIKSVDIGAVTLFEAFIKSDPPSYDELLAMNSHIQKNLDGIIKEISMRLDTKITDETELIFTAGTATTLSAIKLRMKKYSAEKVNNTIITYGEVKSIYDELISKKKLDREKIIGLEKGRVDIIISGTALALNVMAMLHKDKMTISDSGLLEGIITDLHHPRK